jgi:hypothetical protein
LRVSSSNVASAASASASRSLLPPWHAFALDLGNQCGIRVP